MLPTWIAEEFDRAQKRAAALPPWARPLATRPIGSPAAPRRFPITEAMVTRAVDAACEEAGWDWPSGPDTEDPTVPSPQSCMEPIVRAAFAAVFRTSTGA